MIRNLILAGRRSSVIVGSSRRNLHFSKWIESIKPELKPPVANRLVYPSKEDDQKLLVMVVAGPNNRKDYHINEGEEVFYQVQGDMVLNVIEHGNVPKSIKIRENEVFVLPACIPHSPQRFENTLGLVIERKRLEHELDGMRWYDDDKDQSKVLYQEFFHCTDLGTQLVPVIERYNTLKQSQDNEIIRKRSQPDLVKINADTSLSPPVEITKTKPPPLNFNGNSEFAVKCNFVCEKKSYENQVFLYQLSGSSVIEFEDRDSVVQLNAGHVELISPNKVFSLKNLQEDDNNCMAISLSPL